MSRPIAELMQRHVVAIDVDDSVADIQALFEREHVSWAPVLDAGSVVVGVVSLSDLLPFRGEQHDPTKTRAWQLCTYKPVLVADTTPAADVAKLMCERQIHHVVVTDAKGIAGVVSALDFVRAYAQGLAA